MDKTYDIAIIGGGPGGLTAGLYAARARFKTLLIEREMIGGQIANAELVENFPGFPNGISGFELGQLMKQQAEKHGLETAMAEVTGLRLAGDKKSVQTGDGNDYQAHAVPTPCSPVPLLSRGRKTIPPTAHRRPRTRSGRPGLGWPA